MGRRQRSRERVRAERAAPNPRRVPGPPSAEPVGTPTSAAIVAPESASSGRESTLVEEEAPPAGEEPVSGEPAAALISPALELELTDELEVPPELDSSRELEVPSELDSSRELEVPPELESSPELARFDVGLPADEREPPPSPAIETGLLLDRADATDAVDAEIGVAIAEGDTRRALALCAELHGESVGRLCLALLGSQTEADTVTEEVLLEAYRRSTELGAQSSRRGWLLGLARLACVRRLERRPGKRRKGADEAPPSSERGAAARARQARAVLGRIRPSEREALVLRFAAGASTEEAAVACDIEPADAQRRVSRALARLRDALEGESSDD
jgi:RNA polymerase sigma-70 factor, ECF subfamily